MFSSVSILLMVARAWIWGPVCDVGDASRMMRSTGFLSTAWNSMGCAGFPNARVRLCMQSVLPWGMAMPWPMPVVRVCSLSQTASCKALAEDCGSSKSV